MEENMKILISTIIAGILLVILLAFIIGGSIIDFNNYSEQCKELMNDETAFYQSNDFIGDNCISEEQYVEIRIINGKVVRQIKEK